jgi:hypothetical protein
MKKTRKVKNKKIFLKWLKKSYKNKYSTKHGGAPKTDKEKSPPTSEVDSRDLVSQSVVSTKDAVALAAAVTLGEVAYRLASNPIVVSAVVGLGIGTTAFTAVASGGATLVLVAVGTYAYVKIKAAYSNYYTMLHVMNDFILLLQKIDIMVRVAIKISQQYQFFIDTKDVNKCLERIFSKFDKLLSIEDIGKIRKEIEDSKVTSEQKLQLEAKEASNEEEKQLMVNNNVDQYSSEEPKDIKISLWSKMKKFYRVMKFNSKDFTNQLNEEVTRLGLYFSILLGEFNIVLNVSQMNLINGRDFNLLMSKNISVKSSPDFKKLLISSIIYRTLQIHNIFSLCTPGALISDAAKKTTCSKEMIDQYVKETEAERVKIRKILFGKSKVDRKPLFPLYQEQSGGLDEKSGLKSLRDIMRSFDKTITDETNARDFAKQLHEFNEKYSDNVTSDSSIGSTKSVDNSQLGVDYYEDEDNKTKPVEPITVP